MKRSTLFALIAAAAIVAIIVLVVVFRDSGTPQSADTPAAAAAGPMAAELLQPGPLPDQAIGPADAPVTIIEYASLTCPHCGAFHRDTYPALKERFVDTGKVRFIFREFPLDNFATAGFMMARCGGEGKYFPILDAFFAQQEQLAQAPNPLEWLQAFGKQVGFTQESLEACLSNQQLMDNILAVRQRASEKFGVTSTPTFFINGNIKRGALSIEDLEKEIEPLTRG